MAGIIRQPCDEGVIRSSEARSLCTRKAGPWVLAATILGSSMAFIDETAVIVALPTIQKNLGATAIDAQWVVEAYTLLLAALVLVGGSRWPWSGPSMRRSSRATGSSCSSPAGRRSRAHSALLISGKKPKERDEENAYEEAREDTQEYVLVGLKS